jgi:citronellol/citronellal dehydrogenase
MTKGYRSVFAPGLYAGKVVIVTGGGSGIGRCIAHELASLGAHLVITGRTPEKLNGVVTEITADGGSAEGGVCDSRDEDAVTALVKKIADTHGEIHGLVNNAGGQFPSPIEHISKKGFEAVVRNNLVGSFLVAREVFKQSMKRHGGSIVNITADCANGFPGMAHTGAARAGTENFCKSAAWEWGPYGVRVNAVAPGWIASAGLDTYDASMAETFRGAADKVPLKRMASEAELSAAVCFLLSPAAGYINGATLHVDGGGQFGSASTYSPLPDRAINKTTAFDGFHRGSRPKVLQD